MAILVTIRIKKYPHKPLTHVEVGAETNPVELPGVEFPILPVFLISALLSYTLLG
jgi:hypothetical protein